MTDTRDIELRFGSDGVLRVNVDGVCELRSKLAKNCMLRIIRADGADLRLLIQRDANILKEEPQ